MSHSTSLGKLAADTREKEALSLRAVAKKAKVSPQSVADVENGNGGMKAAVRVLKALGVPKGTIRDLVVRDVCRELQLA